MSVSTENIVELVLVRQMRGEIPADRHPPNRKAVIKLRVREEGGVSLAEAAALLQQKVGLWQEEGGWVRRDLDIEGGFLTSVAVPVLTAELGGLHGWLMSHRQTANEVMLTPTFYGVNERESVEVKEEANRELIWTLKKITGSAPGLLRQRIGNLNAAGNDLRGIVSAIESRDYPGEATANTTAALMYECEALTPLGIGAVGETAGAGYSNNKFIIANQIPNTWQVVMGSEIAGVGHMTHIGNRKIMIRAVDGSSLVKTQIKLEYRTLGAATWSDTGVRQLESIGVFGILDLGECRIDKAVLGNQRWEWRISVKNENSGVIRFDKVWILPTEQIIQASTPLVPNTPINIKLFDDGSTHGFEAVTGKLPVSGPAYAALEKSDADDFTYGGGSSLWIIRSAASDTGTFL
jgi:hypothetical protein